MYFHLTHIYSYSIEKVFFKLNLYVITVPIDTTLEKCYIYKCSTHLKQVTSCQLQSKLDGYNFTVWTTTSCPKSKKEWDDRSSLFNCNHESSLACLPNENYTELLEFCYPLQIILIQKGKYRCI